MTEPEVSLHPQRRRLWIALAVTAVALPLLVLDNLSPDSDRGAPVTTRGVVAPASIPPERPPSGPAKGVSVVTSSTTSSTLPIVITTTTRAD